MNPLTMIRTMTIAAITMAIVSRLLLLLLLLSHGKQPEYKRRGTLLGIITWQVWGHMSKLPRKLWRCSEGYGRDAISTILSQIAWVARTRIRVKVRHSHPKHHIHKYARLPLPPAPPRPPQRPKPRPRPVPVLVPMQRPRQVEREAAYSNTT